MWSNSHQKDVILEIDRLVHICLWSCKTTSSAIHKPPRNAQNSKSPVLSPKTPRQKWGLTFRGPWNAPRRLKNAGPRDDVFPTTVGRTVSVTRRWGNPGSWRFVTRRFTGGRTCSFLMTIFKWELQTCLGAKNGRMLLSIMLSLHGVDLASPLGEFWGESWRIINQKQQKTWIYAKI